MMLSIRNRIEKIADPIRFQGDLKKDRYFEGWYYKLASADAKQVFAFIPGISLDKKSGESHAFVQAIDGNSGRTDYFSYPLDAFHAAEDRFEVRIGGNCFTADRIALDLENDQRRIAGDLRFSGLVPWPPSLLAPGIMGWYSFVPFMECYHGLVSMDHGIDGAIQVDRRRIDLSGGRGYAEKDWGTSFPKGYVWMQSNHFEQPGTSFMGSIARIPWVGSAFTGFLAVLWHAGKLRVFTTYTRAELVDCHVTPNNITARIEDRDSILEIEARKEKRSAVPGKTPDDAGVLKSPTKGAMKSRIVESLTSTVDLRLLEKGPAGGSRLIYAGQGRRAGLEIEATNAILEL
jgi:tocopherol cyclase